MNCYYLKCLGGDVYIYELKHCLSDILLRHSTLQLRSIVIFDNFVVLVALSYNCILLCNKSDQCI